MKFLFFFLFSVSSFSMPKLNLDRFITVSGISSGAFFAHQFHLSHSKIVKGAALFAGGPIFCARGKVNEAIGRCMKGDGSFSLAQESLVELRGLEGNKKIDKLKYLRDDDIYLFTGLNDTVVDSSIVYQLKKLYHLLGVRREKINFVDDLMAGHTYPTLNYGNKCSEPKKSPFISSCKYNGALESLKSLYKTKTLKRVTRKGELYSLDQTKYFKRTLSPILMQKEAFLYVPDFCERNKCDLHVAFHGCSQTLDHIQKEFINKTGIKEAADQLNLVVLFPQGKKSLIPGHNPYGCWDWWGHSGNDYHNKKGQQISIVARMINDILD